MFFFFKVTDLSDDEDKVKRKRGISILKIYFFYGVDLLKGDILWERKL